MARVCHCVGHLTNLGGQCCMDLRTPTITTVGTSAPAPLTEERIRQIIREELAKAAKR